MTEQTGDGDIIIFGSSAQQLAADEEAVADQLHHAGLRVTRPRLRVYEALRDMGGHRSVDEIVLTLSASGTALPRMTVYNVVRDLQRAELVMQADAGPGRTLYEAATTWHHHFVCRSCGCVVDVPCVIGQRPCLEAAFDGGTIDEAQVIFRGYCRACAPAN